MAEAASSPGTGSRSPRPTRRSARLRRQLVEELERGGGRMSPPVRSAFLAVPREYFVPDRVSRDGLEAVYRNEVILTAHDDRGVPTSSSSQPSIMVPMLEQLDLHQGQRVLEIGAGTGYNAALLAEVVGAKGRVVSIELEPGTARAARRALQQCGSAAKVVVGDGRDGWHRAAPYDRIIVTASAGSVPLAWFEQLAEGGLLQIPLRADRRGQTQAVVTFRKEPRRLRSVAVLPGGFMPLRDRSGAPAPESAPSLSASERVATRSRPLMHLSGEGLRGLSAERRQALLSLALSEPRSHRLGMRAPRLSLALYLALEAPASRFLGGWGKPGVIGTDGRGLALLAGARTFTRIEAYGEPEAEHLLVQLIDGWRARGRPTERELQVEVSFRRGRGSSIRWSWEKQK